LFAWHPLHIESVAWVAERKDVLSAFFFMLTLWTYGRYAQTKSRVEGRGPPDRSRGSKVEGRGLGFRRSALGSRLSALDARRSTPAPSSIFSPSCASP
jgi:hypothetical protein